MNSKLKQIWQWAVMLGSGLVLLLLSPFVMLFKLLYSFKRGGQTTGLFFTIRQISIAAAVLVLLAIALAYFRFFPLRLFSTETIPLVIGQGESFGQIAGRLDEVGLISSPFLFKLTAKFLGKDRKIYAGKYDFKSGQSMFSILEQLSKGGATAINVTIPPGLTIRQIAGQCSKQIGTDSVRFVELTKNPDLIRSVDLQVKDLEGFLYPETYNFYWKTPEEEIIKEMATQFKEVLFDGLGYRPSGVVKNELTDLVVLASIIEREAYKTEEFPLVSAVFHNRLKRDMPLQCDPTILYVLPPLHRPIMPEDLKIDSPYNTYKYYGLPPGPICNPSKRALAAALNPAPVNYLYFVHRGDGTHIFSNTLEEHNRAIWMLKKDKNS
jgi:UPF0755 protein